MKLTLQNGYLSVTAEIQLEYKSPDEIPMSERRTKEIYIDLFNRALCGIMANWREAP